MIAPEVVDRAIAQMSKSAEHAAYFFDQLSTPDWIEPLAEHGLFENPPGEEIVDGYVIAPFWPQSRYLARVAEYDSSRVLEVIRGIDSNNERVHEDFTEAALLMPPPLAAEIAQRESAFLAEQERLYYRVGDRLVDLVLHVAAGGERRAALELASELLLLRKVEGDANTVVRDGVRGLFSEWEYGETASAIASRLTSYLPHETVGLLAEKLDYALEASGLEPPHDHSEIWFPDLLQPEGRNIRESLVMALGEASVGAARAGVAINEVYGPLAESRWKVIRRIGWSALSEIDDVPSSVLAQAILGDDELRRADPSPEFRALVTRHFSSLDAEARHTFEEAIEGGPQTEDVDRWRTWTLEQDGVDRSDEYVKVWKLRRFALISNALEGEHRTQFEDLRAELGDREFAPRERRVFSSRENSPRTLSELQELPDSELITYLSEWVPNAGWDTPTVEGLAREVRALVAAEPERFSRIAAQFGELDPNYIAALFEGLRGKASEQAAFTWSPILTLSERGLQRSASIDRDDNTEPSLTWRMVRQEIAMLLSDGFEADSVPMQERPRTFGIIRELLRDPDPTNGREERAPEQLDPSTLSLNSIRGQGFHAAMRYGLWVRRAVDAAATSNRVGTFDDMPELREVLEERLGVDVDPSMTIRSAFGQWFPWLVLLDSEWSIEHVENVFPDPDEDRERWWSAWGTYVCLNPVYDNVFATLTERYRIAISLVRDEAVPFAWFGSWESVHQHLVDHLMVLFWRDKLPESMVAHFFEAAPLDLRKHALESLGRGLGEVGDEVDDETLVRVCNLFEARLEAARASTSEERHELDPIGWWLETPAIATSWKLENLIAAIDVTATPTPDFKVYEFLAAATGEQPVQTMKVLQLLINIPEDPWTLSGNAREIERALIAALASDSAEARTLASEIANRLGALGYRNFRTVTQRTARPGDA